jgi:xanthine dehydrogenase accessory factor
MTERSIVEAAARLRRHRDPYLVATVVSVQGSAYRRPGARMLMTQFRWIAGSVSGGCLEGDISNQAWWKTRDGEPVLVTYDGKADDDADDDIRSAFGLGCDGVVDVMLERAGVPGRIDVLEFSTECLRTQRRGAVVTVFRSDNPEIGIGSRVALRVGEEVIGDPIETVVRESMIGDAKIAIQTGESFNRCYATPGGTIEAFIEAILPPPRLFLFGTGHDAVPVVQMARALGWDVSICTSQPRVSTRQRFINADEILVGTPEEIGARIDECDRGVAVVMNHQLDVDRENLGMLLGTRTRYIGVLGPRARTARMLADLGHASVDDPRIHAPVGLELGAETPEEVALAIVAEIQSAVRQAPATSLPPRAVRVHDRSERATLEMAVA